MPQLILAVIAIILALTAILLASAADAFEVVAPVWSIHVMVIASGLEADLWYFNHSAPEICEIERAVIQEKFNLNALPACEMVYVEIGVRENLLRDEAVDGPAI